MKIDPSRIHKLLSAYNIDKLSALRVKQKSDQIDEVHLSGSAQSFHAAFKAAMGSPDIRTARVEKLKALYDAGKYNVEASKIAESIIDHASGKK